MAEPRFADDDDLPRTLRRERDARERELRERESQAAAADETYAAEARGGYGAQAHGAFGYDYGAATSNGPVTVSRLDIPFMHLVVFLIKAVLAAVPALVLLTVLLWGMGQALKAFFPALRHFEIVVKSAS